MVKDCSKIICSQISKGCSFQPQHKFTKGICKAQVVFNIELVYSEKLLDFLMLFFYG